MESKLHSRQAYLNRSMDALNERLIQCNISKEKPKLSLLTTTTNPQQQQNTKEQIKQQQNRRQSISSTTTTTSTTFFGINVPYIKPTDIVASLTPNFNSKRLIKPINYSFKQQKHRTNLHRPSLPQFIIDSKQQQRPSIINTNNSSIKNNCNRLNCKTKSLDNVNR